jgi:SAM-dependent methyltransferase
MADKSADARFDSAAGDAPSRKARTTGADWNEHYLSDRPPWESGRPSSELRRVLAEGQIKPCRVIDLGCGAGIHAVWLAQQGFDVTAVDFNTLALERARALAEAANFAVRFVQADVLQQQLADAPFPFFFDRGCYHVVRSTDAQAYLRTLERLTAPGSLGLLLTGNAKHPHAPGQGPPVVAEEDFHAELGPLFEIVRLREFQFDEPEGDGVGPMGWSCLVRRR